MSRGPGYVQQAILALIESDQDGAWPLGEVCQHVYGVAFVEKKHRNAVARALRTMVLPEPWQVSYLSRPGAEYCLFNACSVGSQTRFRWHESFSYISLENMKQKYSRQVDGAREAAEEATQFYSADAIGRLDIEIAHVQKRAQMAKMFELDREYLQALMAEMTELKERRRQLIAEKEAA